MRPTRSQRSYARTNASSTTSATSLPRPPMTRRARSSLGCSDPYHPSKAPSPIDPLSHETAGFFSDRGQQRSLGENRSGPPATGRLSGGQVGEATDVPTRSRRSEEHTSELQSLMRISYAVFCVKKEITQHKD